MSNLDLLDQVETIIDYHINGSDHPLKSDLNVLKYHALQSLCPLHDELEQNQKEVFSN